MPTPSAARACSQNRHVIAGCCAQRVFEACVFGCPNVSGHPANREVPLTRLRRVGEGVIGCSSNLYCFAATATAHDSSASPKRAGGAILSPPEPFARAPALREGPMEPSESALARLHRRLARLQKAHGSQIRTAAEFTRSTHRTSSGGRSKGWVLGHHDARMEVKLACPDRHHPLLWGLFTNRK
jgi:hypothetical protein